MTGRRPEQGDGGWGRATFWPPGAPWRGIVSLLVIFGAYVGAVVLYPWTGDVAVMWLPNAVLVTALLRFRPRDWPYVYAAGLLAEVIGDQTFDMGPYQALPLGVVNNIEATLFVLAAALIARGRHNIGLLSVRGAMALIVASVTIPVFTGALGGAIVEASWTFGTDYFTAWRTWWFGDSLGLLAGVPIGLLLRDAVRSVGRRRSGVLQLGGGAAASLLFVASGVLAANGSTWGAQQTALAASVLLSVTFGAIGAPTGALFTTTVTIIGVTQLHTDVGSIPRDQGLLFVVFAAVYVIAATTESVDQAMGQVSQAKEDLESANAQLSSFLEAAPDALIIVGPDGRIVRANAQTDRLFGYRREDLVNRQVEMLMPSRFRGRHSEHRMAFFAAPTVRAMGTGLELWGLGRDGTEFPVAISLSPLRTDRGLQVLAAIRDVTERHEHEQRLRRQHEELVDAQQELQRLARFDSLTGLANRAETLARLEGALRCARDPGPELGVLFCDIDHFKAVNDTWGHAVGDLVLSTLATRISECVRHGDTVGRTGGDEMLVLLPGLHGLDEAVRIAEKIQHRTAEAIHHCGNTFHVTVSIGATLAIPGETVSDMTARADAAMYQAKRSGGNTISTISHI